MEKGRRKMMKKLMKREEGISALEYILIALVIALVIVIGASVLGSNMNDKFDEAGTQLGNANVPAVPS